ncbi:MFS transporter [uncultured Alistipes sp.]|uniref:MFS transporter n=1 Tax=uncultured Alistipes sp. TaxID=538949 RepID=UPI0025EBEBAC|nr:MFS transporter [uncultured Alistipes sp.]
MDKKTRFPVLKLLPVLFCFGIMGFIDIVGVATSYVKQQYDLSDKVANLLPSMALMWFILISLPTGILMRRIGRKNTVLFSLAVMAGAMLFCFADDSFSVVLLSFALLGIGNTVMQVSINPLLKNIVQSGRIASAITFGQFVKAVVSFLGPILIGVAAVRFGDWRFVFVLYAAATLLSFLWLFLTPIPREVYDAGEPCGIGKIFSLLGDKYLLVCFSIILFIVGFEISLMTAVPKYLAECCGLPLEEGALGCSLFYAAKTVAAFAGALVLARVSPYKYLKVSLVVSVACFAWFMAFGNLWSILISLALVGLATANVFAIVLSMGMQHKSEYANEISALMITGIAGGAILPPIVGIAADLSDQRSSLFVPMIVLVYILFASVKWLKNK